MPYLLRRRRVGRMTCAGIASLSTKNIRVITPREAVRGLSRGEVVIRWGCTAMTPCDLSLNKSEFIHRAFDKKGTRLFLHEQGVSVPRTWSNDSVLDGIGGGFWNDSYVVRPRTHAYGRDLYVIRNEDDLIRAIRQCGSDGYVSKLIDKMAEYRVMIVQGKVLSVIRKRPQGNEVAWNRHQGATFQQIHPERWRMLTVREAMRAFNASGLDYAAIDVIVDHDSQPYVLEINTAPAVRPWMQQVWAQALDHALDHLEFTKMNLEGRLRYRDYMHPVLCR